MATTIRPWVVRGYDNDTKEQRLYFFDNGYGVSVIDEVHPADGFSARIIRQIPEVDEEFVYSNRFDTNCHMAVMYTVDEVMSSHIITSNLTPQDVQAILYTVRNLPADLDNRFNTCYNVHVASETPNNN